ncbi:Bug family tripartite tricarboxylate transporter substrate binding protein [Zwartia panacis]|uniref:Bug family tripartite tricarboxylate transporter substrate binding protein n=1 Tax=Zwartia panacis TaxID=2683345 RepID=UPI0025B413BD|nr:tripartite tricarboxylate transporter substrate binding protein [Zwartia panacis]MDN4017945.1 tripartite tricarboxylate transporter substrate binding protein [Zwartia panacis]
MPSSRHFGRFLNICVLAIAAITAAATVQAQAQATWPDKAVTFIVPFPPGGPVDTTARLTTQAMAKNWSSPAVIDNKAGAGGIVGAQAAAKSAPDGNHFFFAAIHHAVLPSLNSKLPYDIQKDFVPVGMGARYPIVLVVHPSLPVKNVQELIDYAKANPNKLSYSSAGTGGGTHLAGELFTSLAGVKMQHIPYKGSSPAMQDLVGGQVQLMFADATSAIPFIKSGRVRALAVGNPEPSVFFPDLPTIASAGVKGYEAYSWSGVVAPKGTPPEAVKQANAQLNKVLKDPQVIETMNKAGQEPVAMSPEEFAAFLDNEIKKWSKTIQSAGIKPE